MNSFLSELKQWSFANFPEKFAAALPKLIVFIVVIAVGFWLSKLAGNLIVKILESKNVDKSMHRFVNRSTVIFLRIIVAVIALEQIGFNVNSFITALGAAGITAGLGLQNSIAQLAGGIQILFNKPFKSGDFVEIDNVSGKVREIRFMYTTLVTNDNKLVVVPNQKITTSTLINYTARDKLRLDLTYSISYDDDIEKAKKVLKQVVESEPLLLKEPKHTIGVSKHGASGVDLACFVWCKSENYWPAYFSMQEKVKLAFDKNGIHIPYDQLDVHINK